MIKLDQLPKTTTRQKKRVGKGYGSGKGGHTVGRGQKGQNVRGHVPIWFEGGQLPQIRRFPFIRGKNRFDSLNAPTVAISLSKLNVFTKNQVIDVKQLVDAGLIKSSELNSKRVKIVANGDITIPLTVAVPVTQAAAKKIEAAGGQVNREQTD
jgi:large subunit ribosomal protein L15